MSINISLEDMMKNLPDDYRDMCWETNAMCRKAGIQDEKLLLTLCLYYTYEHSLMDTKNYAKTFLSVNISDVGFMKRFARCNDWFKRINECMMEKNSSFYEIPEKLKDMKILAVDASDIVNKSAVKQIWRLHYAVDLFSMSSAKYKITAESEGESLRNFNLQKNELVLADRIYATISGIEHCLNSEADFVLRLRNKAFNLYNKDGSKISLQAILKTVGTTGSDFTVYYKNSKKHLKPVRLCAIQKTEEEKLFEHEKMRKTESKKQIKISEETKFTRNYFFVITSLDSSFSCEDIFKLYRLRWQVEMVFKRFKSILNFGSMPTKTETSCEAWLNCKMLIAILIEKFLFSVDFSPYQSKKKYLERNEVCLPVDCHLLF